MSREALPTVGLWLCRYTDCVEVVPPLHFVCKEHLRVLSRRYPRMSYEDVLEWMRRVRAAEPSLRPDPFGDQSFGGTGCGIGCEDCQGRRCACDCHRPQGICSDCDAYSSYLGRSGRCPTCSRRRGSR